MHQRAISSEPELARLADDAARKANWKRWGPYLSARQWGTVREDYSKDGDCWNYFPHEHARSRTYRWGEDGLLGLTDRQGRLCFSIALWNGADRILKERLFGLTNGQGNHGEDVKEQYFYLESTPTHSWMHALYKYPQRESPYARLVEESARRSKDEPEYELLDTGVFDDDRYFDVFLTYAKAGPDDVLIEIKIENRARTAAPLVVLPTVWFRNTWSWGNAEEGRTERPRLGRLDPNTLWIEEHSLGAMQMKLQAPVGAERCEQLFTENVSNARLLWGSENESPYVKDAFHDYVIANKREVVNPDGVGTKGAWLVAYEIEAGGSRTLRLRLSPRDLAPPRAFGDEFGRVMAARKSEHDAFFDGILAPEANADERRVIRQAYAGLLWSKQFYHYAVDTWLQGDPAQPAPPAERKDGRNRDWRHLYNRDVLSMPDTWEYP
jgi:hypothetical protein